MNIYLIYLPLSRNREFINMRIHWKRLIWVIFICLYSGLFFYNFLYPFNNWLIAYIYTMIFIIWLGVEYYERHLFFQTGFLPIALYSWPLRSLFALFFYSSFIIGISTIAWWHKNQIGLYPFIQIIGFALLIFSIFLRRQSFKGKKVTEENISQFYLSTLLLVSSIALGYGSKFLILYVIIIGFPLIYLQRRYEYKQFKNFEDFVRSRQKNDKIKTKDHANLWEKYIDKQLKKRQKK